MFLYARSHPRGGLPYWRVATPPQSDYWLRGLGYRLELEESWGRGQPGVEAAPSDHPTVENAPRRFGDPRWGDHRYCRNGDPWTDGRDEKYKLIASPRSGTVLSPDLLKAILEEGFDGTRVKAVHR